MTFNSVKAIFQEAKLVAFGDVGAAYTAFGTPLTEDAYALWFSSSLDSDVWISFDGVTDQIFVPPDQFSSYQIAANKQVSPGLAIPKGTQLYQKQGPSGASGSGNLVCSILSAE